MLFYLNFVFILTEQSKCIAGRSLVIF